MEKIPNSSDFIVRVDNGYISKTKSMFQWNQALTSFEKLKNVDSSKLKKILNKCVPREFLLYFSGSPINNSFAYFFNVSTDKIYKKSGVNLSKFTFTLMSFAILLVTIAVYFTYPNMITNAFSVLNN